MPRIHTTLVATALVLLFTTGIGAQDEAEAQGPPPPQIDWVFGPADAELGDIAGVKVPAGYTFANGDDARKIMEFYGNPPTDLELGYIEPEENAQWYVVFEFSEIGYVKDDDKDDIDPDEILQSYRDGNEQSNEWRAERGIPPIQVVGWQIKPAYKEETNTLEWATILEANGQRIVNYNIRLLGRHGVMEATIVLDENSTKRVVPEVKKILTGYEFQSGQRYADYVSGDKVAEYGLAALVAGGAAVVAAKTGLFAALFAILRKGWYVIVAAVVGVGSWLRKFFSGEVKS